jgi:UDP-glucose 4-epimerase
MTDPGLSIAVTGAAGYIGSRVVTRLRTAHPDWSITALDNFYRGDVRRIGDIDVQHVDIRHRNDLETALSGADIVMHLAAVSGVDDCTENPDLAYDVNVTGTNNVAWFCRKSGTGLVFPFSMAVVGDPESFPITVGNSRDPMNWYGRTKLLSERAIEDFAADAFPAHLFMISNLYGEHEVDGQRVSKGTVINFFVDRALANEPLTVYQPGNQSRNYVHVDDVARAYVRSAERMAEQLTEGETGVEKYEIASDEDPSVIVLAERVRELAEEELGRGADIRLVDNPRSGETLVEEFTVDTTAARDRLGWQPTHTVEETIRKLIGTRAEEAREGQRVDQSLG